MSSVTITSTIILLENRESLFIKQRNALIETLELNYANYIHALLKQKLLIANKIRHKYDEFIKNNRNFIDQLQTNLLLHLITDLVHSQNIPNISSSNANILNQINKEQSVLQSIESIHDDKEQQQCTDSPQSNNIENDSISPFPEHMTMDEANKICIDDDIDHRDFMGWFTPATIVDKQGTKLKIHYSEWGSQYDEWCDYGSELYRFAVHKSISRRPRHRLFNVKKGDLIDVHPMNNKHKGWKIGEVEETDMNSGQIKIGYNIDGNNYYFWSHIDNKNEIEALHTFTLQSVSFECIFCDESFKSHNHLREHIIKSHSKRKCLCKYCPQGFIHHTAVDIHEKQHTIHHEFKCGLCPRLFGCQTSFKLKQTLSRHLRRVHKIGVITCNGREAFVSGHKRKSSSSNNDWNPSKKTKLEHVNEDKEDDDDNKFAYYVSVNCHICSNHYDDIKIYRDHLRHHYDLDQDRTWRHCDLGCNVEPNHPGKTSSFTGVYASSSQFISHIATHTREYPFKCRRCNHATGQLFGLQQHWKNNHYRRIDNNDDDDDAEMELTYERAQAMIVSDLREEMRKRGYDAKGQKKTLLNRIKYKLYNETNEIKMKSESGCIVPSLENMPIIQPINNNNDTPTLSIKIECNDNFVSSLPKLQ